MPQQLDILFDPETDGQEQPMLLGTFPAHVIGFDEGKEFRGSVPYNVLFRIAPEVEGFTGINWKDNEKKEDDTEETFADGEGRIVDASYLAGREVRSKGIWLNPHPKPDERWQNRDYVNFLEAIGIELKEVEKDGKKYKTLVTLEDHEVLGRPVLITVKLEYDKRETHKGSKYPKAFTYQVWNGGKRIDVTEEEEDVFATSSE